MKIITIRGYDYKKPGIFDNIFFTLEIVISVSCIITGLMMIKDHRNLISYMGVDNLYGLILILAIAYLIINQGIKILQASLRNIVKPVITTKRGNS